MSELFCLFHCYWCFENHAFFHSSPLRHPSVNCDLIILYDVIINIYKCTAVIKEIKYTRIELYFKKNTRKNTTKRLKWVRQRAADDPRILTVNVRSRFCCRLPGVAVTGWPRRNAPWLAALYAKPIGRMFRLFLFFFCFILSAEWRGKRGRSALRETWRCLDDVSPESCDLTRLRHWEESEENGRSYDALEWHPHAAKKKTPEEARLRCVRWRKVSTK